MADPQEQNPFADRVERPPAAAASGAAPSAGGINPYKSRHESMPVAKQPGALDVANQYYNAPPQPGEGVLSRVGRSLGRTAMMAPNLVTGAYHAFTDPVSKEEAAQGYTGVGKVGLPGERMFLKPVQQATEDVDRTALATSNRTGKPVSPTAIAAGHALASIPVIGPWALAEGKRGQQGDTAGVLTDAGAMIALPQIAREAMPGRTLAVAADQATGGMIPGEPWDPVLPTASKIATYGVRKGALALEKASSPAAIGGAVGGYVGHKIPAVGTGAGSAIGAGVASAVADKPMEPMISLPGARTLGDSTILSPAEAAEYADTLERTGDGPAPDYKVAMPGKTISMDDYINARQGLTGVAKDIKGQVTPERPVQGQSPLTETVQSSKLPAVSAKTVRQAGALGNKPLTQSQGLAGVGQTNEAPQVPGVNPYTEGTGRTGATIGERTYRAPDGSIIKGADLTPVEGESPEGLPQATVSQKIQNLPQRGSPKSLEELGVQPKQPRLIEEPTGKTGHEPVRQQMSLGEGGSMRQNKYTIGDRADSSIPADDAGDAVRAKWAKVDNGKGQTGGGTLGAAARELGVELPEGDKVVIGRSAGLKGTASHISRTQVFDKMLENHSWEEIDAAIDRVMGKKK